MYKTFFLLKPDAVTRNLVLKIIERLKSLNFIIIYLAKIELSDKEVVTLCLPYTIQQLPPKFREIKKQFLIEYLKSNYCVYIKVEMERIPNEFTNIFQYAKSVSGSKYYPEECSKGSIRYDFRDKNRDNNWKILEKTINSGAIAGEIVFNLIHTPKDINEYNYQSEILNNLF